MLIVSRIMDNTLRKALLATIAIVLALSSCHRSGKTAGSASPVAEEEAAELLEQNQLEYVPFMLKKDSRRWGMMGLDGTVLFADTLTAEPTNAVGGLFVMRAPNGWLHYYTAEADPQQVGGDYSRAGLFYDEVAPCVERGKGYIQFIRKDGSVAFDFKEVGGKPVEWVSRFHGGLATFKAGKYVGYVNTRGEVVIAPQFVEAGRFSDGYALVVDTMGTNEADYRAKRTYRVSLIDVTGKLQGHSFASTDSVGTMLSEGLLSVAHEQAPDDTLPRMYKFVDHTGQTIIPENIDYRRLGNMSGTHFAFFNGRGWGVADNQATVILTPRYEEVVAVGATSAVVAVFDKYKFIDYGGNQLGKSFDEVVSLEDGAHFIGRRGDRWYMLDDMGTVWGESCYKLVFNPGDNIVKR